MYSGILDTLGFPKFVTTNKVSWHGPFKTSWILSNQAVLKFIVSFERDSTVICKCLCTNPVCSPAPSQPPMNVQVVATYSRTVEFVWTPPPIQQQNGTIRRYIVNLTSVSGGRELITYSQTNTTLVHNLHPFTNYTCSVSAETVAPGPFSPAVLVQTPEDGKIFMPCLKN